MKILISGCAGFIGYHLTKELISKSYDVLGLDNLNEYYDLNLKKDRLEILKSLDNFKFANADIADLENLKKVFEYFNPDKVINLAAQPGVRYSLINPHAYSLNLVGFLNILDLSKSYNVKGFIYASSSSVYE